MNVRCFAQEFVELMVRQWYETEAAVSETLLNYCFISAASKIRQPYQHY